MNVVLIGFMATGKTTVGRALGRRMDAPFVDMDRELQFKFGMSIPEFFALHGENAFRAEETEFLNLLIAESDPGYKEPRKYPGRFILSTGGGVPQREINRPLLKKIGHIVWLRSRVETIAHRCRLHIDRRPMLHGHHEDLEEHIVRLLSEREPAYETVADTIAWSDDQSTADKVAAGIKAAIKAKTVPAR